MTCGAQQMHRHENRVSAQEGNPEMPDAEALAHHAAKHLGKPEMGRSKDSEHSGHGHNQMEVCHYKICVVQVNIQRGLRQHGATQPSGNEQ